MEKLTEFPQWGQLKAHAGRLRARTPRDLTAEPGRIVHMCGEISTLHVDWSRQLVDAEVVAQLISVARWRELSKRTEEMFSGVQINSTESRSVLHTALRALDEDALVVDGVNVGQAVQATLARMREFADGVRSGRVLGSTGARFTDVINIGIGGSDLGPAMAVEALRPFVQDELHFHFVSNVDPTDITSALAACDPETTLILIASKTFTTAETMANARTARAWLAAALGETQIGAHLAAMSTALSATREFGIDNARVFGFWDWVGGRYSIGSAIGLSLMLAIGPEAFEEFLLGMREVDTHFRYEPLESNIPVLLGMFSVWNRNVLGISSTAVLPYDQRLRRFPAYLQQLSMESNGKSVTLDGTDPGCETGAVLWGEPGTNGQHSFHQLLHQGTDVIECHVIAFAKNPAAIGGQHQMLLANALAQAELFATGRSEEDLVLAGCPKHLIPHKVMHGGRPTNLIVADQLDPRTLGALIALYEHVTFVQGVMWGINSFDQWGVEYGKEVATSLLPLLSGSNDLDSAPLHPSTRHALHTLRLFGLSDSV